MGEEKSSSPHQAGRVKDAQGRVVSQLDPVMMHLLHRHDTIPRDALQELAHAIGIKITRATRLAFWGGLACLVVCTIALTIMLIRLNAGVIGVRQFVRGLIPFMGSWIGPFMFWATTRSARHQRITQVMHQCLRCPHCGYDIRGLPTEPDDGATICPDCGCAWRLEKSSAVARSKDGACRPPDVISSDDTGEQRS